jgi:hypothetical protein
VGFLDKRDRVTDFILTEVGRKLYAVGQLDFTYFALFDDGLDYDPYATGTLSDSDREVQVRALPMWEAPYVRDRHGTTAPLEPTSHLFMAAAGYDLVPFMLSPADGDDLDLMCDQRALPSGSYRRSGTGVTQIKPVIQGEAERVNPGFEVRVFSSGTNGLTELFPRTDLEGRRAFDPFIAAVIDNETVPGPTVDDPSSSRQPNQPLGPNIRSWRREG